MKRDSVDIYDMLNILREAQEETSNKGVKKEEENDVFPYSTQDTLMTNTLDSAKQEFGADFNSIKNPMLYYPSDGDVTLSGIIPELNDAKFQFRYKVGDGAGCYMWANPYLPISDKTLLVLNKVNGVCKNWRTELSRSEDYKPSAFKDPDNTDGHQQGQAPEQTDDNNQHMNQNMGGDQNNIGAPMPTNQQPQPMMEQYFRRGDDIELRNRKRVFRNGDDLD